MIIEQRVWTRKSGWEVVKPQKFPDSPQLVLAFGGRKLIEKKKFFDELKSFYPQANVVECSTAGEILAGKGYDNSVAVTAVLFEKSKVHLTEEDIKREEDTALLAKKLIKDLPKEGLVHLMVFSDGLKVNATDLMAEIGKGLPKNVTITGGLVGDGPYFKKTVTGLNHVAKPSKVVLVAFYGNLKVGYGLGGGWDAFGVERVITKSKGKELLELDGKPALDIYEEYLGGRAKRLPQEGLRFPLRLHLNHNRDDEVVRTILGINRAKKSLIFGGDMPEGARVSLMKASFERLVDGAYKAGKRSIETFGEEKPELAILVSCVGRKLVLERGFEEEIEAVTSAIGENTAIAGFYSYGQLCPTTSPKRRCLLHNQTMTVTTFREK